MEGQRIVFRARNAAGLIAVHLEYIVAGWKIWNVDMLYVIDSANALVDEGTGGVIVESKLEIVDRALAELAVPNQSRMQRIDTRCTDIEMIVVNAVIVFAVEEVAALAGYYAGKAPAEIAVHP